ncbi:glycosyltransferase family 2 protein [Phytohabitans flavus]|uniref:glycosyltransferase family 2 protein n=1 Tax=Phytohabitans flavus TaxID=1076124 RepID=UPI003642C265
MSRHRWSVVTVTYNSADTLRQCWSGAKPYDWIVVDNDSTDDSVAVARELGARVVRLPANVGFSKANNAGVRESDADYVLFANPDLEVEPDGLERLQAHLDTHGGLVAPQLLGTDGEPQPNGRGFPYATAKLGNRKVWPLSNMHAGYRVTATPGTAVWVVWVMGAAVAAKRDTFVRIGGWNERFFLYYEDHELGLRAWREGSGWPCSATSAGPITGLGPPTRCAGPGRTRWSCGRHVPSSGCFPSLSPACPGHAAGTARPPRWSARRWATRRWLRPRPAGRHDDEVS